MKGTGLTREGGRVRIFTKQTNQDPKLHVSLENRTDSTALCMVWVHFWTEFKTTWSRWRKNSLKGY